MRTEEENLAPEEYGFNNWVFQKMLTRSIKESDWKVLRKLHKVALERFCENVLLAIDHIISDKTKSFHQKYLEIYDVTQRRDKEMARIFDNLRRSTDDPR